MWAKLNMLKRIDFLKIRMFYWTLYFFLIMGFVMILIFAIIFQPVENFNVYFYGEGKEEIELYIIDIDYSTNLLNCEIKIPKNDNLSIREISIFSVGKVRNEPIPLTQKPYLIYPSEQKENLTKIKPIDHLENTKFQFKVSGNPVLYPFDSYMAKFYIKILGKKETKIFNWNEIPGNESNLLIEYLSNNLSLSFIRPTISKSNDTIYINSTSENISLRLNDEKTNMTITEIDSWIYKWKIEQKYSGIKPTYYVKRENGDLNIYESAEAYPIQMKVKVQESLPDFYGTYTKGELKGGFETYNLIFVRGIFLRFFTIYIYLIAFIFMIYIGTKQEINELFGRTLGYFASLWLIRDIIVGKSEMYPSIIDYITLILFTILILIVIGRLLQGYYKQKILDTFHIQKFLMLCGGVILFPRNTYNKILREKSFNYGFASVLLYWFIFIIIVIFVFIRYLEPFLVSNRYLFSLEEHLLFIEILAWYLISSLFAWLFGWILFGWFSYLISIKLFKGNGSLEDYINILGFSYSFLIIIFLVPISFLLEIVTNWNLGLFRIVGLVWVFIINMVAIKEVSRVSWPKVTFIALISIVIILTIYISHGLVLYYLFEENINL